MYYHLDVEACMFSNKGQKWHGFGWVERWGGLGRVEQGEIQAGDQVILWEKNISFNYKEKNEKRKRSNLKVEGKK